MSKLQTLGFHERVASSYSAAEYRLRAPPAMVKGKIQPAKHQANQKGQELTKTSKYAGIQHRNVSFATAVTAVHNHLAFPPLHNIIQLIKLQIPNSQVCVFH